MKRSHRVASKRTGASALITTLGRTMPPTDRPTAKHVPTHRPAYVSLSVPLSAKAGRTATARLAASLAARSMVGCGVGMIGRGEPIVPLYVVTVAATIATPMNVGTAASERSENRERPQRPWPLVHPLPSATPSPTARPDSAIASDGARATSNAPGRSVFMRAPPPIRPPMNAILVGSRGPSKSAFMTPELPAMRPTSIMYAPHAAPMNRPPRQA
mmetsp:Transcript_17502/g.43648  ORF Transcript_17502/g.43648 Transcript_17502/m.43648 type:complete len:215 (-) Transcript_17502:67-711(-)